MLKNKMMRLLQPPCGPFPCALSGLWMRGHPAWVDMSWADMSCLISGAGSHLSSSSSAEEEESWRGPPQPGPTTIWDAASPTQMPAQGSGVCPPLSGIALLSLPATVGELSPKLCPGALFLPQPPCLLTCPTWLSKDKSLPYHPGVLSQPDPRCRQPGKAGRLWQGTRPVPYMEQSVWLSGSRLDSAAVAAGRGGSRARSSGFGPVPPAAWADSSGRGSGGRHVAPGAACLLRRKQGPSCSRLAEVSGSAAPALRRGLEHLGEQAWRRHLAEECVFLNSLLCGVGLAPPRLAQCRGVCGAPLPPHSCLHPMVGGEPCCHPKRSPLTGARLCCQPSSKAWDWQASSPPSCGTRTQVGSAGGWGILAGLMPEEVAGSAASSLQPYGCRLQGKEQPPQAWCGGHKADAGHRTPFQCCPQPPALSSQVSAPVLLHPSPAELVLACSPLRDTAACATLATRWTPAASAALVGWHLFCLLGLDRPFSPSGSGVRFSGSSAEPLPACGTVGLAGGWQAAAGADCLLPCLGTDEDECLKDPCAGRGRCINSVGSYLCLCYSGYTLAVSEGKQSCEGRWCLPGTGLPPPQGHPSPTLALSHAHAHTHGFMHTVRIECTHMCTPVHPPSLQACPQAA